MHLTEKGKSALESISRIAREHRQDLLAALSEEEQRELTAVCCGRVAEQQGLIEGVHPGFAKDLPEQIKSKLAKASRNK